MWITFKDNAKLSKVYQGVCQRIMSSWQLLSMARFMSDISTKNVIFGSVWNDLDIFNEFLPHWTISEYVRYPLLSVPVWTQKHVKLLVSFSQPVQKYIEFTGFAFHIFFSFFKSIILEWGTATSYKYSNVSLVCRLSTR